MDTAHLSYEKGNKDKSIHGFAEHPKYIYGWAYQYFPLLYTDDVPSLALLEFGLADWPGHTDGWGTEVGGASGRWRPIDVAQHGVEGAGKVIGPRTAVVVAPGWDQAGQQQKQQEEEVEREGCPQHPG